MENQCPKCGSEIKTVPAGVSKKTGRPYSEFKACSNRDCDWKPERKTSGFVAQHTAKMEDVRAAHIKEAQERKEESITKFNALNAAINLVCRHEYYKYLTSEDKIIEKVFELQKKFYDHNSQPFL